MSVITLQPAQDANNYDTLLYSSAPNTNYNTYDRWEMGHESTNLEQEVVRYDLSSIPNDAIISAVKLIVYVTDIVGTGDTITFRRILAANSDWSITQATWNIRKTAFSWAGSAGCSTVGTDTSNTKMAEVAASSWGAQSAWKDITLDVDEFKLMWANNYGFWAGTETGNTGNRVIFFSMDASSPYDGNRPKLEITYTQPPPLPSMTASRRIIQL